MPSWEVNDSKTSYELTIDVVELLGGEVSELDARIIGTAIVDDIVKRTRNDGKDVNGNTFKAYKDSYKDSFVFDAAGKSSKVNLTLFGTMLNTLGVKEVSSDKIVIGWDDSFKSENGKAHRHNTGNQIRKREFLGLTASQEKDIKERFSNRVQQQTQQSLRSRLFEALFG